ncbi:hypothetical protein ACIQU4_17865 [Streptomyces sp. NPDC090741]|uniref:hypothetical protein n=1 Tax=Streptomyces sp. NPDC090741 TaxID=3365967 RepID=UPI0037F1673F
MHTPSAQDSSHLLGLYLNDHLAGSSAGLELLNRAAKAHDGRPLGPQLERLAREVEQDRESLKEIMGSLEVPVRRSRAALGWLGEKAGRLKLNRRLFLRSPLSDVIELEAMRLGVEGKRSCWRSLRSLADGDDRLDKAQLAWLLDRAEEQAETLERLRTMCALRVFAPGSTARTQAASPSVGQSLPRGAF